MEYTLHYSSADINHSALGSGWDLSIDARLFDQTLYLGNGVILAVKPVQEGTRRVVSLGGKEWHFNADGALEMIRDAYTQTPLYRLFYDSDGHLVKIVDSNRQTTRIVYNGDGIATAIVAPTGQRTLLDIDAQGDLAEVQYEDGSSYAFVYDRHRMTEEIDPNGNSFEHYYDEAGRIVKVVDAEQGEWDFATEYGPDGIRRTVTRAAGDTVTYAEELLNNGWLHSTVTLPSGERISYGGSLDEREDRLEDSCGMQSRSLFRQKSDGSLYKDPLTHRRELKQRALSTPSGLNYTERFETRYSYDSQGNRLLGRTRTLGTPLGTSTLTTDYRHHRVKIKSASGKHSEIDYDAAMRKVRRIKPWGLKAIRYRYDKAGRVIEEKIGSRRIRYRYDDRGNLESVTDPLGRITRYVYDLRGRVTEIHYPDGSSESFSYDANGNLLTRTVPTSAEHHFAYNGVNRPVGYTDPEQRSTTYRYDKQRRVIGIDKPSGKTIDLRYAGGRLESIETPEGSTVYAYACSDHPRSIVRGNERIDLRYDGVLPLEVSLGGTLSQTIKYRYDGRFLPVEISYAGRSTALEYDPDGALVHSGDFTITRKGKKRLRLKITDGRYTLKKDFNGYGELSSSRDGTLKLGLVRNQAGQIIFKFEQLHGRFGFYFYRYDKRGRLTKVRKGLRVVESYTYDANGNRKSATLYGKHYEGSTTLDDALQVYGDNTYRYDEDGYLIEKTTPQGTTTYTYNTLGALTEADLPDGTRIHYLLDPLNRRIAKEVNGTITQKYLWADLTTLLAVYDKDDNLVQRFEYAGERMPVAMRDANGKKYYLHYDQVGSLRAVTDSRHRLVKAIRYDSYGNILRDSNPGFKVPFGFAGGLYDSDTELTHFGFREYDAFTGKWTAKDPLLFGGGDSNLYGYVLGDPVDLVDPSGKVAVVDDIVIVGIAFLGAWAIYEAIPHARNLVNQANSYLPDWLNKQLDDLINKNTQTKEKEAKKNSNKRNDCIEQCLYLLERYGADEFNKCVSECEEEKACRED
ncbi:RHS repeat domain-containing protein [Nitratifractor salsuginis]|uniref:RHS repeat domain-containing protein n=1 Tax=Nitratifractor salsuginis TaxID=269261 RepID=UPI000692067E|nr:RHS repeat-associated core domain-containing protein [Nitratifractor salsuginis]